MALDGVNFVFHNVPGAEAPTELTFTIPDKKAYAGADKRRCRRTHYRQAVLEHDQQHGER
jgi:alkyl sulfatase BDS1-like metallo-beta-lactamase superfamily hydrolase